MTIEGERQTYNPSAQNEVCHEPLNIPEISENLTSILLGDFKDTDKESIINTKEDGTWILDYFEHKDTKIINLFNNVEYRTVQARIFDDSNRVIREIKRERNENIIKWSLLLVKNKDGNWVKLSSDQIPNDQQL